MESVSGRVFSAVRAQEQLVLRLTILYVHEHHRLGFGMLTVETAVFDCIC